MEGMIRNDPKNLTEDEKLQLRKQRFNSQSNLNTIESAKLVEEEKRKIMERQKKFGVIVELPEMEQEKIQKRKERFGLVEKDSESQKLKQRAERFNITSETDILQKRAERFKNELDQNVVQNKLSKPQRRIKGLRKINRKIKKGKRLGNNKPKTQRDRRGPKRSLGFKRFGRRNRLKKRYT